MVTPKQSDRFIKHLIKNRKGKKEEKQKAKYSDNDKSIFYALKWDYEHGQLSKFKYPLYLKLKKKYEGVEMKNEWTCEMCKKNKLSKSENSFGYYFEDIKKSIEPICKCCFNKLENSEVDEKYEKK